MINKTLHIDITPEAENEYNDIAGVMWEHNATQMNFKVDSLFISEKYRYYIEYRSCFGSKVRTDYLEMNADHTVIYSIPVEMSSLKAVEGYFCIVEIDDDGNTSQIIKPQKFNLTFDYSADVDNHLCKVNNFSINYLLEAIRNGTFKGEKGDRGERGDKGETGGISEVTAYKNFANTIKGTAKGRGVVCTYVSPYNVEADISMQCKNLFDISKIPTKTGLTNNGDGTLTVAANNYSINTGKNLGELCPQLKVGDTATLSLKTTSGFANWIFVSTLGKTWSNGTSITVTESILNGEVIVYGKHTNEADYGTETVISNIQIELGTMATEFVPYLVPEKLKLKKYGKNLLPYPFVDTTKTENGITFTDNGDGTVNVNGTASAKTTFVLGMGIAIPPAEYTISGCSKNNDNSFAIDCEFNSGDILKDFGDGASKNFSQSVIDPTVTNVSIVIEQGATVKNILFKPQLEMGKKSEFKAYSAPVERPVDTWRKNLNIEIAEEKTTLIPTTPAVIRCEYNRDNNALMNKLIELAQSLGAEF